MVTGTGEILLVEDDPNDVLLTERALRKNGVRCGVVVARDGEEALDYHFGPDARTRALPLLVLLDLRLPKVDGLEVLRRLRAEGRTRDLPVVLLVSSEGELGVIADRGGGLADLCIRKAVDFERFVGEVGRVRNLPQGDEFAPEGKSLGLGRRYASAALDDRTFVGAAGEGRAKKF